MSYTSQDLSIFVTGIVGRAMGSGNFEPSQVSELTQAACLAFEEHLAPRLKDLPSAPRPAPGGFQGPPAGAAIVPQVIPPETKNFSLWGGDKAYFGKNDQMFNGQPIREVDWATWVDCAIRGDRQAKQALEIMTKGTAGNDPKWQRANIQKVARAKACLTMLKNAPPPADEGPPPDPTPFG